MASRLDTTAKLALDTQSLEQLRVQAKQSPDKALKAVAQQFESVFLNMMLKSMREATPQEGVFDSEQTRMFTGMLDQQMAQSMASRGVGLADIMVKQLGRSQTTVDQAAGEMKSGDLLPGRPDAASLTLVDAALPRVPATDAGPGNEGKPSHRGPSFVDGKTLYQNTQPGNIFVHRRHEPALKLDFVSSMLPHAMQASQASGVPERLMLAQAALASGWGKGEIRMADGSKSYNVFGIKAGAGWHGKVAEVTATEYESGVAYMSHEKFRVYSSYAEAFQDYANMISNNPRYTEVLQQGNDEAAMARALQKAGYATDPQYADKLNHAMEVTSGLLEKSA